MKEELWKLWTCLYADDAVLLAESERELHKMVKESRKLKGNTGKSKVAVLE